MQFNNLISKLSLSVPHRIQSLVPTGMGVRGGCVEIWFNSATEKIDDLDRVCKQIASQAKDWSQANALLPRKVWQKGESVVVQVSEGVVVQVCESVVVQVSESIVVQVSEGIVVQVSEGIVVQVSEGIVQLVQVVHGRRQGLSCTMNFISASCPKVLGRSSSCKICILSACLVFARFYVSVCAHMRVHQKHTHSHMHIYTHAHMHTNTQA